MVQDCRYKSSCPSASCGLKNYPLMDFRVKKRFPLAIIISDAKAGVLALSREAAANAVAAASYLSFSIFVPFIIWFGLASRMCVRWLRKPSWCAGSDSGWVAALKRQTWSMAQKWIPAYFLPRVENLVSLSSVHCVSWKILDYTHQSFRTDSLHCCILLQITAQDFAVDSRPIVAAWSVYQKGRNLGTVFQDQPSSQVWALF